MNRPPNNAAAPQAAYVLDEQVGYRLRLANQKHLEIFARELPQVTPTQFAVLARLLEVGEVSQNHLGRLIGTDAATTKGVVSRLAKKSLVNAVRSQTDRRRLLISLTDQGSEFIQEILVKAQQVSVLTTGKLTASETEKLNELLGKL